MGQNKICFTLPASDYEDMGVHTISPYKVLPHTVENHDSGRDKRNNPTKTVYAVYYQTLDGLTVGQLSGVMFCGVGGCETENRTRINWTMRCKK